MTDDRNALIGAGPKPTVLGEKAIGSALGFALEFREQTALVALSDRELGAGLCIDALELEVPDITFPFDVTGGADQFRHRRCRLRRLELSATGSGLADRLRELLAPERFGIEQPDLSLGPAEGRLSGVFRVGRQRAPFSARFHLDTGDEMQLRFAFHDVRLFDWLPVPASALVAQLARALKPLRFEQPAPFVLALRPVADLLRWLLPIHGWKLPEMRGLRLDRVTIATDRLRLATALFPDELPAPGAEGAAAVQQRRQRAERDALVFREGVALYDQAERALAAGQLEEARSLYLNRGEAEPTHPLAASRLMQIELTRPDRFDTLQDRVRDQLAREPEDVQALLARAAMQAKRGQADAGVAYERAAQVLRRRDERDDAVTAYLRAGELLAEVDRQRSIAALEQVLVLDADRLDAMRLLAAAYEEAGRWYRALRMHLRLARRSATAAQTAEHQARMGRIYLEQLDDLERARKQLDAALINAPQHLAALELQAEVQRRRAQPTRAARLLGKALEQLQQREQTGAEVELRLRLARLWEEELDDPAVALRHYTEILDQRPEHLDALHRAGRLAMELDQPEQAAEAFGRLLELEQAGTALPDNVVKSAGMSLGRIYRERPDGLDEARRHYARVVEVSSSELDAWRALEEIDRQRQDFAALVDVLEQKAVLVHEPQEALAALLEAAELAARELEDGRRAEQLYHRSLQLEPGAEAALAGLSDLLQKAGRWAELERGVLESIHADLPAAVAAARWSRIGSIRVEHLGDLNGGIEALSLAVRLHPADGRLVRRLIHLLREHGRHQALVELVPRLAREAFDARDWIELWLERARLQAEKLGDAEGAIDSYRKVLDADPGALEAQRALADLLFAAERWPEARQAIEAVLESAGEGGLSGPGRTELHRRLAAIELRLGNRRGAIEQYRLVLSRYEADQEAADRIAELLREDQRWEELAAFYGRRAETAGGEEAAVLHTAAASIWWDKLERLEPAANQYRAAVDAAPDSEGVQARLASLQRLHTELGHWEEVAEVLRRRIATAQTEQVPALSMALAAVLRARLDQEAAAAACWRDALAVAPDFRPALVALAERCAARGDHQGTLQYGQRALQAPRPELSAGATGELDASEPAFDPGLPTERRAALALLTARAAWAIDDSDSALDLYRLHLEAFADRGWAEVEPEALERLELLLRKARAYEELARLYRRWLKTDLQAERQPGIRRSLALLLYEHLDDPDEAIQLLADVVREQPQDQPAVRDLLSMLRRSSRWEQLARLLEDQWSAAADEHERIERLEELAELYQLRLHDSASAIEHLQRLLQMGYLPARERLLAIYRQEDMVAELADLLAELAEEQSASDPDTAAEIWAELGHLARDELDQPERSLAAFERAFEAIPSDDHREIVLELLRETGTTEQLADFLARCADDAEDPALRRALLLERADVCLIQLEDLPAALAAMRAALEIEPEEAIARRAQALYEEVEDWAQVADMQELLIDLADGPAAAAQRLHRLGGLYRDRLAAPERAIAAFEKAAELDPSWLEPNRALAGVLADLQRHAELIEVKTRIAQAVPERQERSRYLREAAGLAFDELDDPGRGVDLLQRAAELAPDPAPVWLELADRLEALGELTDAADALERLLAPEGELLEMSDGGESPAALYRRIASLRRASGDAVAAIAAYERTLRQEPSDGESARVLEALYRAHDRHEDLAQMLTDLARRRAGVEAAETWLAVAEAWSDAGDAEAQEAALQSALEAAPEHAAVNRQMAAWLEQHAEWARLLELLQGLDDGLLAEEGLMRAGLACYEGIGAASESDAQELAAARLMLRIDPVHLEALGRAARLAEADGRAEEAEDLLRRLDGQADRLEPDQRFDLDMRLARLDFNRGQSEKAETRLKRCIALRPDDPEPRAFLHKLYAGGERYGDRVALLLDEAERATSPEDRFDKVHAAARLMEEDLGDPEGASRLYLRLTEQQPDNLEAWRRLAELYRLLEEPVEQRRALIRVAELTDGDEHLRALRKVARLSSDVLELEEARQDLDRLLAAVPGDPEALDRLIALDRREGAIDELTRHLAQRIDISTDPIAQAGLLRERAGLLVARPERRTDAIAVFERLRELLPSDDETLHALERLYLFDERWSQAAEVLERRIGLAGTERERVPLLSRLARLRADRLDDAAGAVDAWRRAAALEPANREPLEQLRRLATERGDDELLVEALESLAARAKSEAEECGLRRAVGLLHYQADRGEDASQAFARVLELREDDAVARRFSARLSFARDPRGASGHLRWLADHAELLPATEELAVRRQLVEALAEAEPTERIAALEALLELAPEPESARALAALYREVGDRPALAALLSRIGEMEAEAPTPETWIERADLLLQEGQPAEAAAAMQRALDLEGPHRLELARRLAQLQLRTLDDRPAARASLEQAHELAPEDRGIMEQLVELRLAAGDEAGAAALLERWLERAEPEREAEIALQLGRLHKKLGHHEAAREALERSTQAAPSDPIAWELLAELADDLPATKQGMLYLRWAGGPAAGARRPELYRRAAEHLERADDEDSALRALREAFRLDPADPDCCARLAPLLRRRREWVELAGVLEQWSKVEPRPEQRVEILFELGELERERLDDEAAARHHLQACLELAPEHHEALAALAELHHGAGEWAAAEDCYARMGDQVPITLAQRRGDMALELERPQVAAAHYARAVENAPENAAAHLGLVRALAAADDVDAARAAVDGLVDGPLDESERDAALRQLEETLPPGPARAAVLGLIGELEPDGQRRAELWLERAELLREQGQIADMARSLQRALAIDGPHRLQVAKELARVQLDRLKDETAGRRSLEAAVELTPDDPALLSELSELYWKEELWDRAAEVTERLLELAAEEMRPGLALRLGDIQLARQQPDLARPAFERALELDPAYRQAYERLEQLMAEEADSTERAEFYLRWARSPAAGSGRADLLRTAARQLERAGEVDAAMAALREALEYDRDNPELVDALLLLLGQQQQWDGLIEALQRRIELETEDQRVLALHAEIGQIYLERLDDQQAATEHLEACLALDPDHAGSLEQLAGIRYAQRQWEAAGDLYERLGDRVSSGSIFLAAFRLGEIRESQQRDAEAVEHYRRAVAANPSFLPARQNLVALLQRSERWEELIAAGQALIEALPDSGFEDMAVALQARLAAAHQCLLRFEPAAALWRRVLESEPEHRDALQALRAYHTNRRDWSAAAEMAERQLALEPDSPRLAAELEALGDLYRDRLQARERAERAYRRALEIDPERSGAAQRLWDAAVDSEDWETLTQLGPRLLAAEPDSESAIGIHRTLGRALLRAGGDREEALEHLEAVLESGRADLELIEEGADLARQLERWARYACLAGQALEHRLQQGLDPEAAMEGYLDLARVYQEELGDVTRAAAAVRRALELQPRDPELLRRLGHLYASNFDTYREAIEVFRELLGMDPGDAEAFRFLARLEAARGEVDRTACYYAGLRFLQPANAEARRYLGYVGAPRAPQRALSDGSWDEVVLHPRADCLLQRIMAGLAPFIEQLFPPNLSRFKLMGGVVGPEENPRLHRIAEQARRLVAGRPLSLLIARENVYQSWIESGQRPTLIISSAVLERSAPAELQFFITREVVRVAMGCVLPAKFNRNELLQLLAVISRLVEVDAAPVAALPPTAGQYVEAMRRVTPDAVLQQIQPLVRQFALEPRAHDTESWLLGVTRTAARAGLLACGDLNASLSVLTRFSAAAGGRELAFVPDRASLLAGDEDMLALFRFAFSEPYFKLRQELGLAVGGD